MGYAVLSAWYLVVLFLLLGFPLQGNCKKHSALPSTLIAGTVYCDTCSEQRSNKLGHFISGASIQVECTDESKHIAFRKTAITNPKGLFKFSIPPEVHKNTQSIKNCTIDLLKTSHATTFCDAVASVSTTSALEFHLKSTRQDGIKVYSAGTVTFKPLKKPAICDEQIDQPAFFFFPPNPLQPPNIGGVPIPQNPLVPPPPSLLPPGFQPTPPSIFPPGLPFFQPPPPPSLPPFNIPLIPGLTPPSPSPPPPGFPLPPILPPGLPGVPPGLPGVPPGLPGVPPGLPGVPPGLPGVPPGLPGVPPGLPGVPPGLPGVPPGLPGFPYKKKDSP
ncbi:proline-rich protein 4-like protein [Carex littledalei]|uniref:Proline-rich protein 4-like protein n=1 Tax=Carex littledalei TaxID=544730 RepID=A0A833VDN7_9POAL|nr:proline-rich protein 4-like protein [Carex littledalei]